MATTTNERKQINYNKVVNIADDGEITVLDYLFDHGDGFKGATGSKFYPVSKAEYKDRTSLKSMEERLRESVNLKDVPAEYAENERGYYSNPFRRWAKAIKEAGESEDFAFDCSYRELWDDLRAATGLNMSKAYIFDCVGGGRCFNNDFQGNVNPELSELIRQYESK